VHALVSRSSGAPTATYEYSPFGETLRSTGTYAATNPFRFSTKYTDGETGLLYYGRRYYNPTLGRWLGRDPIEERGGLHLYAFCGNNGVNRYDVLGMWYEGDPLPEGFEPDAYGNLVLIDRYEGPDEAANKQVSGPIVMMDPFKTSESRGGLFGDGADPFGSNWLLGNGGQSDGNSGGAFSPVNFGAIIDRAMGCDGLRTALAAAMDSSTSYKDRSSTPPGAGQQAVNDLSRLPSNMQDALKIPQGGHGAAASVFQNPDTGQYTVAFRGTANLSDWVGTNFPNELGFATAQLIFAGHFAAAFVAAYGNNVLFTGHSKGGAEADVATLAAPGTTAITFNSEGVAQATLDHFRLSSTAANGQITNYHTTLDPVTLLQPLKALGTQITLEGSAKFHGINGVIKNLQATMAKKHCS